MLEANLRDSDIKRKAFKSNDTALELLSKADPDFFKPEELLCVARSFRGCAIYINFNDRLRNKIDSHSWLGVMAPYSWDAQIAYTNLQARNVPTMF